MTLRAIRMTDDEFRAFRRGLYHATMFPDDLERGMRFQAGAPYDQCSVVEAVHMDGTPFLFSVTPNSPVKRHRTFAEAILSIEAISSS